MDTTSGLPESPPQFLAVGHLCRDLLGGSAVLGGSAAYAGLCARRLGLDAAVLTSLGADFEFADTLRARGLHLCNKPASKSTVFENSYHPDGRRTQYLHARAETLYAADLPEAWRSVPVVLCCPIAGEVDFSLLEAFPGSLVGATIQGWLRAWDARGLVRPREMDWSRLAPASVVVLSDADVAGFEHAIPALAEVVRVLVLTQGARGATVFANGEKRHFPAFPVQEVDATGAGDVFAAAFLIRYAETRDPAAAAAFAHCAASFVVEGVGIENLATAEQVAERVDGSK